jgi:hypothetical protein
MTTFSRIGGRLTSCEDSDLVFTIGERKQTSPAKSRYFLVQKAPTEKYVSSLWPTDQTGDVFEFETGGHRYVLTLSGTTARINPKGGNGNV